MLPDIGGLRRTRCAEVSSTTTLVSGSFERDLRGLETMCVGLRSSRGVDGAGRARIED